MKKYLILAAAAALVACSSESVRNDIVIEDTPIGFSNIYVGKSTKANAGEINTKTALEQNGNTIKVWGWKTANSTTTKVFNGTTVTYTSNASQSGTDSKWVYSPLKFWDKEADYEFYAVAPHDKFTITESEKKISATGIAAVQILADNNGVDKITAQNTDAVDYLVAGKVTRTHTISTISDVEFTFSHILSKLAVKVKTSTNFPQSGQTYPYINLTKLDIKLQGMCDTYTQKTAGATNDSPTAGDTWNGTAAGVTTINCFNSEPVMSGNNNTNTVSDLKLTTTAQEIASYLVAPTATGSTPASYTYKVTVEYDIYYSATEGDVEHFKATDKDITGLTKFAQNTSNVLTITVAPQAIYFDVTDADWTFQTGSTGEVTID